ncbi:MAG: hypothetical protein K0A89_05960 [ANME-2 cluster archaeon]|nr:hypothetical protein [ANME-2 cluster archaeon]
MKSKSMKLGAVFAMMLIVGMAFVPAVSAKAEFENNQFDISNFQSLTLSDIENLSDEEIEALMTEDQKKMFKDLAKQDYPIIEVGDDKIITVPTIDANGKISKQKVKMTHLSKTDDTELYLIESGQDKELLTVQHIGENVRVTGYAYDKTKALTEYDVAALRDHGNAKFEVWVEDGYLRIWFSPNVVNGSVLIGIPTLTAAILVALFAAGIALTVAATAGAAIIAGIVIGIVYMIYAGPDGDFDYWVEISDISKFVDKYTNWWPYDYGIMDSYAGLNRNHYIPIPYGPV